MKQVVLGLLILGLVGCGQQSGVADPDRFELDGELVLGLVEADVLEDSGRVEVDPVYADRLMGGEFDNYGVLGSLQKGREAGVVRTRFGVDGFELLATFEHLPNDVDYEGFLVRREPVEVISLGQMVRTGGIKSLVYGSEADWREFDVFVLTSLESGGETGKQGFNTRVLEGMIIPLEDYE